MIKAEEQIFNLFPNCIPVKGIKRSIICDVYRGRFRFIPNVLYYILTKFRKKSISEIKFYFENKNDAFIDEYFNFLGNNEFGFFCTKQEQSLFPKLDTTFENPFTVTNCIIDIDHCSNYDLKNLFKELEQIRCLFWQIRIYENFHLNKIENIFSFSKDIHLNSIHLITPYHNEMSIDKIIRFYKKYPIAQIDFHSVPAHKLDWNKKFKHHPIKFHKKNISDEKHCGVINSNYFNPTLKLFAESQNYNSCLNQKISIDVNGEIKNCPSMKQSFGNIKNTKLQEVIIQKEFRKYWNINKDQINICQDCEFRYICTDCRAYLTNPEDILSKPLKCGYNPYTSKWEEWSNNPLKQSAIKYYEL
ncbi:MAG TPA: grasp-with-spasm system SPASM domain peptide maturase [Bacteroidia bacterium]|jgi:SPASM domain peptide maturase of grasp-with-spasm system|nr:grasp-with-spasm system SPASM domain peptide maturase [Bacteroidia bacterium]